MSGQGGLLVCVAVLSVTVLVLATVVFTLIRRPPQVMSPALFQSHPTVSPRVPPEDVPVVFESRPFPRRPGGPDDVAAVFARLEPQATEVISTLPPRINEFGEIEE